MAAIKGGSPIPIVNMGSVAVKIAPSPFNGEGCCRWPTYAHLEDVSWDTIGAGNGADLVVRRFKDPAPTVTPTPPASSIRLCLATFLTSIGIQPGVLCPALALWMDVVKKSGSLGCPGLTPLPCPRSLHW